MKWLGLRSARRVVFGGAVFLLFLVLGGLLWRPAPAGAVLIASSPVPVFIDGQKIDVPETGGGVIIQNRTLVPLRFVAEHLGGEVTWDQERRVAVVIIAGAAGEKVIEVPAAGNQAKVNGRAVPLDVGARIIRNRVFVPLRFIGEAFGARVEWKDAPREVHIARAGVQPEGAAIGNWACAYGTAGFDYGYAALPRDIRCTNLRCPGGPLIYIAGSASDGSSATNLASNDDALLCEVGGDGKLRWTKSFGRRGIHESLRAAAPTGDGGLLLLGVANTSRDFPYGGFLLKTNGTGEPEWFRAVKDSRLLQAVAATSQDFFVAGAGGTWPYDPDAIIMRLDATGSILWQKALQGRYHDEIRQLIVTQDAGALGIGLSTASGSSARFLVAKLTGNGEVEWQRVWGPGNNWMAFAAAAAPDGGYVVVGRGPGSSGGALILKLDARGHSQWQLSFDGTGDDCATAVATAEDGYLVAGNTSSFGGERLFLLKVDPKGRLLWKKAFYDSRIKGFSRATALTRLTTGGFLLTGVAEVDPFSHNADLLLLRLDENGKIEGCSQLQELSGGTVNDPKLPDTEANLKVVDPKIELLEASPFPETGLVLRSEVLCRGNGTGAAKPVTVQGVLQKGVECPYVLKGYVLQPHKDYPQEYAKLSGYLGQEIRVTGYAHPERPTICMQGTPFEVMKVEPVSLQPAWWRETEDFETGIPRQRWRLEQGGCVPTSSQVAQYIDGYLRQAARDGGMDGHDCIGFTATRDFTLPAGFQVQRLDLKVSWRVPEFSQPGGPHGGKEGYADLVLISLDGQGKELGRLRYRVSGDDRSGYGTHYLDPPGYGMSDGAKVVFVHGQGQVDSWQTLAVTPTADLPLAPYDPRTPGISPDTARASGWARARTLRVVFEFAAGYMYSDEWTVDWDNLELIAYSPGYKEQVLEFLDFIDKKFGKEYGQLIEQLKSSAQENDTQRYKTLGNQFAEVLRRDHPELLTYCTDSGGCDVAGVGCCWCWPTPHPDCGGGWSLCLCATPPGVPGDGGGGACGLPGWIGGCGIR